MSFPVLNCPSFPLRLTTLAGRQLHQLGQPGHGGRADQAGADAGRLVPAVGHHEGRAAVRRHAPGVAGAAVPAGGPHIHPRGVPAHAAGGWDVAAGGC